MALGLPVHLQGMGHTVLWPIGRIARHVRLGMRPGTLQQRIGQTAVLVMQDADFDTAPLAVENRGETVDRDQDRLGNPRHLPADAVVKRPVIARHPLRTRGIGQIPVARHHDQLTLRGHCARCLRRTVQIINQPRHRAGDQDGIQPGRQMLRHRQRTRVPGGMAGAIALSHTKPVKFIGDQVIGMFTDQYNAGCARGVHLRHAFFHCMICRLSHGTPV